LEIVIPKILLLTKLTVEFEGWIFLMYPSIAGYIECDKVKSYSTNRLFTLIQSLQFNILYGNASILQTLKRRRLTMAKRTCTKLAHSVHVSTLSCNADRCYMYVLTRFFCSFINQQSAVYMYFIQVFSTNQNQEKHEIINCLFRLV
jgi:hypothetical protein